MRLCLFTAAALAATVCAGGSWTLAPNPARAVSTVPEAPAVPHFTQGETETNRIDLLLVFDASACGWLAGKGLKPGGYAEKSIADLNRSLAYTGIDRHFKFRLAGVLDLSPLDLSGYELSDIVSSFAPFHSEKKLDRQIADRVRQARDVNHADVVAFFTMGKNPVLHGFPNQLLEEGLTDEKIAMYADNAYCACKIDFNDVRHSLLHEIGHLFGAGHSNEQRLKPGPQLFPYSSAYRFRIGGIPLTTVVGYPEVKGGTILPFFSSPNYVLTYSDESGVVARDIPIGTSTNDNTRTVIATYPVIAQYRVAKPTEEGARFESGLRFLLEENGQDAGKSITMRCGVKREFKIRLADADVCVCASRLPSGFSYDEKSMTISGKAVKPGINTAILKFVKSTDALCVYRRVEFRIEPLPSWAIGRFASENGKSRIAISDRGYVQIMAQVRHSIKKASQDCFIREEKDSAGNPVFILEDGKRLQLVTEDGTKPHGVICDADGSVFKPVSKTVFRRRGKSNKKTTKIPMGGSNEKKYHGHGDCR